MLGVVSCVLALGAVVFYVWSERVIRDPRTDNRAGVEKVRGLEAGYWACCIGAGAAFAAQCVAGSL